MPRMIRPRLAVLRGQSEGEQLRLVADLGERNDADGNEKCVNSGIRSEVLALALWLYASPLSGRKRTLEASFS